MAATTTAVAPATKPTTAEDFIALEDRYGARNYKPLDVVIDRAEGAWVWDVSGRKYLDCLAAYSAVNQGHCHPKIVQAMVEQANKVALTSRAFRNSQLGSFYRELCELLEQADNQVDETAEKLKQLASRLQQENERLRNGMRGQPGQQSGGGGGGQRQLAEEAEQMARQLERLTRENPRESCRESPSSEGR